MKKREKRKEFTTRIKELATRIPRFVVVDMGDDFYRLIDREDDYGCNFEELKEDIKDIPDGEIEFPENWRYPL